MREMKQRRKYIATRFINVLFNNLNPVLDKYTFNGIVCSRIFCFNLNSVSNITQTLAIEVENICTM